MKYQIIFGLILLFMFSSCTKNNPVKIVYEASGAISEYSLSYVNVDGELMQTTEIPQSAQDSWTYSFKAGEGDIVYVAGKYADINSSLNIVIKIDGKVYKQGQSQGDTLKYLVVSGVVASE